MMRDVNPSTIPNMVIATRVLDKPLERRQSARTAREAAV